ncbi:protein of unknown function [Haloechinothrix alba]|uniref:DUF397 domain-containing protein n=1 Tax=Haloechinothrix alba TaxID=664784 RepID=A0A238XAL9_9PSEU|nr:DUF397 domain-containing protein [Haloechinothrix alba]SNR55760.1 protein of unknown function [Haloechinothrix alba]
MAASGYPDCDWAAVRATARKAQASDGQGACVMLARTPDGGAVFFDSKLPEDGPFLYCTAEAFRAHLAAVKGGELDAPQA